RLNAGYITCYFVGGALGSLLGAQLWGPYGWNGIVVAGGLISALALGIWAWVQRRIGATVSA
ncbi:hypothetical protein PF70_06413, partial [Pseudomonas asplenii]